MKNALLTILILASFALGATPAAAKGKKAKKPKTTKVHKKAPDLPRPPRQPFVTPLDAPEIKNGLSGKNIALWQSHGRYFDLKEERWKWQRARILGTVEDIYTQSYILPFLIPMLENAGAYTLTPRERDMNSREVIIDMDGGYAGKGYKEKNGAEKWSYATGLTGFALPSPVLKGTENPFRNGSLRKVRTVTEKSKASTAQWYADIPETGDYALYISYASLPESAPDARYTINSLAGSAEFEVNQKIGGSTWVYLGTFPFAAGQSDLPVVELSNISSEKGAVITADAVRIGGGMGNVARGASPSSASISGYPRYLEGARYWLQWAGMPASVYSFTEGVSDYEDDYKSRGLWVNYLAGGSSQLPGVRGLAIPIDLSFALHSDAGTTSDPYTTIGTMPIINTKGEPLGSGESRSTSLRYATLVTDQIIRDIQMLHDPSWTRRKLRDKAYHEVTEPRVPSLLIELLSHQNYADMRLGLDPGFRFDVSRAIYKGMLKYLCEKDGRPYTVQPLPVSSFAITGASGSYLLSWEETPDTLEPTARPTYYIVYERIDDGPFTELAVVDDPLLEVKVSDSKIYSYKIVAANDGGLSFPSEILSLCHIPGSRQQVSIVNGFTRISGPAETYSPSRVGFDFREDFGVPYISDILFTGYQTEFRPGIEWTSDDNPGHGASHADFENSRIAGNTFDFVYIHGKAIRAAGHPFISCSLDAFTKSMPETPVLDIILGKQREISTGAPRSRRFKPFSADLCNVLRRFCDSGGALFISGSYISTDLFDNPFSDGDTRSADSNFGRTLLGVAPGVAQATLTGEVREVKSRYHQFTPGAIYKFCQKLNPDIYAVEAPESFAIADSHTSAPILRYCENDYIAGVAFNPGSHRSVTLGFPFESILSAEARAGLMTQILNFLSQSSR